MKYNSTRNKKEIVSASEAIIRGIATDGGLYVPEYIPKLKNLDDLIDLDYTELASYVLKCYFDDLGEEKILNSAKNAYDNKFPSEVAPVMTLGKISFIELYHGRTLAFKDMALSILPHLLKASLEQNDDDKKIIILVATSGDTGKAALEGFNDVEGINVIVYFPDGGVSEVQRLQMLTHAGRNTDVVAIDGNFDDAQTGVKEIFTDEEFKERILKRGYEFSSANSINIGRLVPQIIYYINSYLRLVQKGIIVKGSSINVTVPTGNFGNLLAAYYAKEMGLPIDKLIVASNDNNVLTDFFKTGEYNSNRDLLLTSSPSMDILVSSNLERFLYHISNGDSVKISEAMESLKQNKSYNWDEFSDFVYAGYANEDHISNAIASVFKEYGYTMDPHTAVAYYVANEYIESTGDNTHMLIASTASPFKFPAKVLDSLGEEIPDDEFESLELLSEKTGLEIPESLFKLRMLPVVHKRNCKPNQMRDTILEITEEKSKC